MADAAIDNTASARPIDSAAGKLFAGAVLAGCAVALLAGIYGKAHDPASETTVKWFFTSTLHLKAWFTTVALALAILQVLGGMWMFGKLGSRPAPKWVGGAHRITGSPGFLRMVLYSRKLVHPKAFNNVSERATRFDVQ